MYMHVNYTQMLLLSKMAKIARKWRTNSDQLTTQKREGEEENFANCYNIYSLIFKPASQMIKVLKPKNI